MCDYPIAQVASNGTAAPAPTGTSTTTTVRTDTHEIETVTKPVEATKPSDTVTLVFKCWAGGGKYRLKTAQVQRSQLRLPECVICIDENLDDLKVKLTRTKDLLQAADNAKVAEIHQSTVAADAAATATAEGDARASAVAASARALIALGDVELTQQPKSRKPDELKIAASDSRTEEESAKEATKVFEAAARNAEEEEKKEQEAMEKRKAAVAAAQENQALVADAGAFDDESTDNFLHKDIKGEYKRPFLNPALIFGLIVDRPPLRCDSKVCYIGRSGRHHFFGNNDLSSDPRQAYHDFELLLSAATLPGTVVGGKPVVAIQTSPTEAILQ